MKNRIKAIEELTFAIFYDSFFYGTKENAEELAEEMLRILKVLGEIIDEDYR